jgi:hypothetical protein
MFLLPCEVSRTFELGQEIPIPLVQRIRPQSLRSRLLDQQQHPRVVLRPPDPGRLGGGRQVHLGTRHRRHLLPLHLDQFRGLLVLLSRPWQGPASLQLHLGLGQLPLVGRQLLRQLLLGQDPAILPQHPKVVQLGGQGQPPPLSRQVPELILDGPLPGLPPDDLQLTGRQGHDAPQLPLQFLGGQDLDPPLPVQAPGLDDPAVQSLDGRALNLAWGQGSDPTSQLDLQPVLPGGGQHRVRHPLPASPRFGQPHHVPPVVPTSPTPVRHLGRNEGQRVGMKMDLAPPVFGMNVIQGEGPRRLPFAVPAPGPDPDRLQFHFPQVSLDRLPQNIQGDLRGILQARAQLPRQRDQCLLGGPEQASPLGQLVLMQIVPHGQLPEQLRGRQFVFGRVPTHFPP